MREVLQGLVKDELRSIDSFENELDAGLPGMADACHGFRDTLDGPDARPGQVLDALVAHANQASRANEDLETAIAAASRQGRGARHERSDRKDPAVEKRGPLPALRPAAANECQNADETEEVESDQNTEEAADLQHPIVVSAHAKVGLRLAEIGEVEVRIG